MQPPIVTDADHVPVKLWLKRDGLAAVMDALGGKDDEVRIVGGVVRDFLLGRDLGPVDIDLATIHTPDIVTARLEQAGIKVVPTGVEHGTVTAVIDHHPYEITTLRADVQTDGRRAVVAFSTDWAQDAQRRDFTINGLYADAVGRVHDYVGGLEDLKAPRLQFIGDPAARIQEDYLRILRLFRFAAQIEAAQIDRAALKAAADLADGLDRLSAERLRQELLKLLCGPNVRSVMRTMGATQILPHLFGELEGFDLFNALVRVEADLLFVADPLRRLFALVGPRQVPAAIDHFRLSNTEAARLKALAKLDGTFALFDPVLSVRDVQRLLYHHGADLFRDLVVLRWAADRNPAQDASWRALLAHADVWQPRKLPITGDDVLKLGVPKGPQLGAVLKQVEEVWIEAGFPDRTATLSLLRQTLQAD